MKNVISSGGNLEKKYNNKEAAYFDYVFFGASILNSLEACYQSKLGKSVLLVDRHDSIGGAWRCISFENFERVENAVHYFLPHENGINFMRDCLNLSIIPSEKKYRFFKVPIFKYVKFRFDSKVALFIAKLTSQKTSKTALEFLFNLKKSIVIAINFSPQKSFYIENGAHEWCWTDVRVV